VRFTPPRTVAFEHGVLKDSVRSVRELRGIVFGLHGDSLVLSVASALADNGLESAMMDRRAALALDQSTTVTMKQLDGWKFAYGVLAASVVIFAALVLSGS
jgi:hypothetical protein